MRVVLSANNAIAATDVTTAVVSRFRPRTRMKPARSPAASAADRTGNAAIAIETPIRLTGTDWKLRAKLTELTPPAANRVASEVK